MSAPVNHLVVVGRDAPLWLAASVLAKALGPSGLTVSAVALPDSAGGADLHASLPSLEALHAQLRLDETDLLRATGGAFTLGWNFVDQSGQAPAFLHPFGAYGTKIGGQDFFPQWLRARHHGLAVPLDDFSLTAAAARQGRLFIPDKESDRYAASDYGYHLPAIAYAAWLKKAAQRSGVTVYETRGVEAIREEGRIAGLHLEDGRVIGGDFFVDVSGEAALLIGTPDNGRESWRAGFPADWVLSGAAPRFATIPVYAEIRAIPEGWVALRPCQSGTQVTIAWSDGLADPGTIVAKSGMTLESIEVRQSDPGLRERLWDGNCAALGKAACALDPLHDLELFTVQLGLIALLRHFPRTAEQGASRAEYNQAMRAHLAHLRDFQSLHYALARYQGPFWDNARTAPLSCDLAQRIDLFRARGDLAPWEQDDLPADSWRAFLIGHGLLPDSYPPAADLTPPDRLKAELRQMLGFVKAQILRQPTQDQYLRGS
ncbi:MAG TPA: tryptophan 7-halogenase [Magnetospirillaceae bacterium]|nr:tryptophan 7-halogenase [Magnetospirillaceae bacterium]